MTESSFWQALRKKLVPRVYALKINLRFVAGIPDAWLSGNLEDLWIELKYIQTLPPVIEPTELLSTLQQEWLKARHAEGRNVGVLIGSSDGHLYFPSLSWLGTSINREDWVMKGKKTNEIAEELIKFVGEVGCNDVL